MSDRPTGFVEVACQNLIFGEKVARQETYVPLNLPIVTLSFVKSLFLFRRKISKHNQSFPAKGIHVVVDRQFAQVIL